MAKLQRLRCINVCTGKYAAKAKSRKPYTSLIKSVASCKFANRLHYLVYRIYNYTKWVQLQIRTFTGVLGLKQYSTFSSFGNFLSPNLAVFLGTRHGVVIYE